MDEIKMQSRAQNKWQVYVVAGVLLLGVFVWMDGRLFQNVSSTGVTVSDAQSTSVSQGADAAASDAMTEAIVTKLANVNGLNDLAILPDGKGDGQYLVSAVVDLSAVPNGNVMSVSVEQQITSAVDTFYKDVYSSGQPVSQAEITFTEDQLIVASSGLGQSAYANLSSPTMGGDLATELLAANQVQDDGANEAWLEIKNS